MMDGIYIGFGGEKRWYQNDQLHREDGPAIEYENGSQEWYLNGKRHREDGPAVIQQKGSSFFFLNNVFIHQKDWELKRQEYLIQKNLSKFI